MSLIYDYLKINGKGEVGENAEIKIPPALLKSVSPDRLNNKSILVITGTCLLCIVLLFFIFYSYTSRQDLQDSADRQMSGQVVNTVQVPEQNSAVQQSQPATADFSSQPGTGPAVQASRVFSENEAEGGPDSTKSSAMKVSQAGNDAVMVSEVVFPDRTHVFTADQDAAKTIAKPQPEPAAKPREVDVAKPVVKSREAGSKAVTPPSFESVAKVQVYDSSQSTDTVSVKSRKFYLAGLGAQQDGDLRTAEIYYQRVLEQSHGHMDSMVNLSAIYVQQERYEKAEEILLKILDINPMHSKALVNLGVIYLFDQQNALAEEYFIKALQANPAEENALVNLAYLAEKRKDFAAADIYYSQLLQMTPDNLELLLAYGYMLEQDDRLNDAMAIYGKSLDLDEVRSNNETYRKIVGRLSQLAEAAKEAQQ
jgi:Tfp pilus assembly protein PilF